MYFNYHAKAKRLLTEGQLESYRIVEKWNAVAPALVLFFRSHKPMPIRRHKWDEYLDLIDRLYGGLADGRRLYACTNDLDTVLAKQPRKRP